MASIDDELRQDALDDARECAYFRANLSDEQNRRLSDADLQFVLDAIVECYALSGLLEAQPDGDELVVDGAKVVDYVAKLAAEAGREPFLEDDLFDLVALEMDYEDN